MGLRTQLSGQPAKMIQTKFFVKGSFKVVYYKRINNDKFICFADFLI